MLGYDDLPGLLRFLSTLDISLSRHLLDGVLVMGALGPCVTAEILWADEAPAPILRSLRCCKIKSKVTETLLRNETLGVKGTMPTGFNQRKYYVSSSFTELCEEKGI